MRKGLRVVERKVNIKTGNEGPDFDPYAYTEYNVTINGETIKFHKGILDYVVLPNGEEVYGEDANEIFEKETGLTTDLIDKIEVRSKCPNCGYKKLEWVSGYPGESLLICMKCKKVIKSYVNKSMFI